MDSIVDLLVGESTTLDIYFLARVIAFCCIVEFMATVSSALLGKFNK